LDDGIDGQLGDVGKGNRFQEEMKNNSEWGGAEDDPRAL
jgi:hypothetical protein